MSQTDTTDLFDFDLHFDILQNPNNKTRFRPCALLKLLNSLYTSSFMQFHAIGRRLSGDFERHYRMQEMRQCQWHLHDYDVVLIFEKQQDLRRVFLTSRNI